MLTYPSLPRMSNTPHLNSPEQWILGGPSNPDGFSLRIEPGQTVAFVGQSGSGKSTLVNFTLRFYDPEQGAILLDGKDLRSLNVHNLRKHVAYVGVGCALFDERLFCLACLIVCHRRIN